MNEIEKLMRLISHYGKCAVSLVYNITAGRWEAKADTVSPLATTGSGPEVALEALELAVKFKRISSKTVSLESQEEQDNMHQL